MKNSILARLLCCLLLSLCALPAEAQDRNVQIGSRLREIHSPLYEAVLDVDRRMLRSISYTVRKEDLAAGAAETVRDFYTPAEIRDECLESADYAGSQYDQGHTRALLLSSGSSHWRDVNCMAVIVPQARTLNQQTIRNLESHIAELVQQQGAVRVQVECLFRESLSSLPGADEPHVIPAGFLYRVESSAGTELYRFPNVADVQADPQVYRVD